jgi:hypothetical protein
VREGGPIGVACVNFMGRIGGEGVEGARHDCEIFHRILSDLRLLSGID